MTKERGMLRWFLFLYGGVDFSDSLSEYGSGFRGVVLGLIRLNVDYWFLVKQIARNEITRNDKLAIIALVVFGQWFLCNCM